MLQIFFLFALGPDTNLALQYPIQPDHSAVDHIIEVENEPTQIVIITSKEGPVEHLKIHIEVVDLEQQKQVNPVDLSGVWLGITRGRYTIPFLRPSTWYGIKFRSETVVNGKAVVHQDERLVKTTGRSETKSDGGNVEVKVHRSLDGIEHFETIFLTVSWDGHRSNQTEAHVDVRVVCDNGETSEKIILHHDDKSQTIEITMDNKYEIENVNAVEHLVRANIIPLKCHKICWNSSLFFVSQFGNFGRELEHNCHVISPTSTTTYLREFKQFKVEENELSEVELVVETEVVENEDDWVKLVAVRLGDEHDRVERIFEGQNNGTFRIVLQDDAVYAVEYEYVKSKPFHYTTSTNFLVETPAINGSRTSKPLIVVSGVPKSFDINPDSVLKPEAPFLLLSRGSIYNSTVVSLNIRPFCEFNETEVVLNDWYPEHQMDMVAVLCGLEPSMSFCESNSTASKCDEPLCFSTAVNLNNSMYGSEVKCTNITQHFAALKSTQRAFINFSMFLLFFIFWRL